MKKIAHLDSRCAGGARAHRVPGISLRHPAVFPHLARRFRQGRRRRGAEGRRHRRSCRARDCRARTLHRDATGLYRVSCDQRSTGARLSKYFAGGALKVQTPTGTYVSRNLTADKETGLARRSDDEVKRVLRSGTFTDGHVTAGSAMPWPAFSNWTEEDRMRSSSTSAISWAFGIRFPSRRLATAQSALPARSKMTTVSRITESTNRALM